MLDKSQYDFGGYATKNDLTCTDGRTIRKDAFKDCDGTSVPLVWFHLHRDPENVLGHAILENREDGVYAYCKFNDTENGILSKKLVEHKDVTSLSIYANELVEKSKNVLHGMIREVSLVMAGANPGALIDYLSLEHSDEPSDSDALIKMGVALDYPTIEHADSASPDAEEKTVGDVFDTLTEEQKNAVYIVIAEALDAAKAEESTTAETKQADSSKAITHSNLGESTPMKVNVFDNKETAPKGTLTHDQFAVIMSDAQKMGSFKQAFLAHAADYGLDHPEYMFPDARVVTSEPDMIERDRTWVGKLVGSTKHTPFSRIKSLTADITAEEARALGYVKGTLKKDEIIKLLRRSTTPCTIYKKQKLDRDDIIDIVDFDVVVWLKKEMRGMLDEELARAILISDDRASDDEDKISEENIRPIYKDDAMYVERVSVEAADDAQDIIEAVIRSRKNYKGSGNPVMFTTSDFLTDMLLVKDTTGRRLYNTQAELEAILRVSGIVEVPVMTGVDRTEDGTTLNLIAIIVNPIDYTIGADKGGQISMFEDFDIDYNQQKYLIETRCSGALTKPKSAIVIEQEAS